MYRTAENLRSLQFREEAVLTEVHAVHDADFRASERDWFGFVEKLTERLIEIDDTVPELPVKDIVSLRCMSSQAGRQNRLMFLDLPHLP